VADKQSKFVSLHGTSKIMVRVQSKLNEIKALKAGNAVRSQNTILKLAKALCVFSKVPIQNTEEVFNNKE